MVFLPDHQVSGTRLNKVEAFGAGVGLLRINGRDVLNEPVPVTRPLHPGGRVKQTGNIAPGWALLLPFTGRGA